MDVSDRMLWMGDLEPYMTAEFISNAFRKMGETVYCVRIVYDKYSGMQAGYCFLEMNDGDACRRCMLNVNGKVMPKSRPPVTFNLSFANSPNSPYTEYNLMVNNLADELFGGRYRSCRGAKVYRHYDGSSKGAGFVRFTDKSEQQAALIEMGRETLYGKTLVIKLQEGRFMAPRGARFYGAVDYDPINYYPITVAREMYASRDYARREQDNYEALLVTQQMPILLADGSVEFPSYGTNMIPPPEKYMAEPLLGPNPYDLPQRPPLNEPALPGSARLGMGSEFAGAMVRPGDLTSDSGARMGSSLIDARYHSAYDTDVQREMKLAEAAAKLSADPMAIKGGMPYIQPVDARTDPHTGVTMINASAPPVADHGDQGEDIQFVDAPATVEEEQTGKKNKNKKGHRRVLADGRQRQPVVQHPAYDPTIWYEAPNEDDYANVEDANEAYMDDAEELYSALDQSRFPPKLVAANVKVEAL